MNFWHEGGLDSEQGQVQGASRLQNECEHLQHAGQVACSSRRPVEYVVKTVLVLWHPSECPFRDPQNCSAARKPVVVTKPRHRTRQPGGWMQAGRAAVLLSAAVICEIPDSSVTRLVISVSSCRCIVCALCIYIVCKSLGSQFLFSQG